MTLPIKTMKTLLLCSLMVSVSSANAELGSVAQAQQNFGKPGQSAPAPAPAPPPRSQPSAPAPRPQPPAPAPRPQPPTPAPRPQPPAPAPRPQPPAPAPRPQPPAPAPRPQPPAPAPKEQKPAPAPKPQPPAPPTPKEQKPAPAPKPQPPAPPTPKEQKPAPAPKPQPPTPKEERPAPPKEHRPAPAPRPPQPQVKTPAPPKVVSQKEVRVGQNVHQTTVLSNGTRQSQIKAQDGTARKIERRPDGSTQYTKLDGKGKVQTAVSMKVDPRTGRKDFATVQRQANGDVKTIRPNGSVVIKHKDGSIENRRGDGSYLARNREKFDDGHGRKGYVENRVFRGRDGREMRERHEYFERQSRHFGVIPVYVPVYVDYGYIGAPGYYSWYYNPWVGYTYTWVAYQNLPFYGYCGGWCNPYRVYRGVNYWITDYVIADIIATRYAERVARNEEILREQREALEELRQTQDELQETREEIKQTQDQIDQTKQAEELDETLKEQIAKQVKETIQAIKEQKTQTLDDVFDDSGTVVDASFLFAINSQMDLTETKTGDTCSVAEGDMIRVNYLQKKSDGTIGTNAVATVIASKSSDGCAVGTKVLVATTDLQQMLNDFAQRIEKGIAKAKEEKDAGRLN